MNFRRLVAFIAPVVILALTAVVVLALRPQAGGRACTFEAKLCPDGTSVGRVWPSCAFADCPGQNLTFQHFDPDFNLRFPVTWRGYRVTPVGTSAYNYVAFTHPTVVGQGVQRSVVELTILWYAPDATGIPAEAKMLGARDGLVFAWIAGRSDANAELVARSAELDSIAASFTLGRARP